MVNLLQEHLKSKVKQTAGQHKARYSNILTRLEHWVLLWNNILAKINQYLWTPGAASVCVCLFRLFICVVFTKGIMFSASFIYPLFCLQKIAPTCAISVTCCEFYIIEIHLFRIVQPWASVQSLSAFGIIRVIISECWGHSWAFCREKVCDSGTLASLDTVKLKFLKTTVNSH